MFTDKNKVLYEGREERHGYDDAARLGLAASLHAACCAATDALTSSHRCNAVVSY